MISCNVGRGLYNFKLEHGPFKSFLTMNQSVFTYKTMHVQEFYEYSQALFPCHMCQEVDGGLEACWEDAMQISYSCRKQIKQLFPT